jgi:hypothetical protein
MIRGRLPLQTSANNTTLFIDCAIYLAVSIHVVLLSTVTVTYVADGHVTFGTPIPIPALWSSKAHTSAATTLKCNPFVTRAAFLKASLPVLKGQSTKRTSRYAAFDKFASTHQCFASMCTGYKSRLETIFECNPRETMVTFTYYDTMMLRA